MYSFETYCRVLVMLDSGNSIAFIARQTGVNASTISSWADPKTRKRRCFTEQMRKEVHRLAALNVSKREISRRLKISRITVQKWLKRGLETVSEEVSIILPGTSKKRCRKCGGLVYMPCLACQLEDIAEPGLRDTEPTKFDRDPPLRLGLTLKPPHHERYEEIVRWREEHPDEVFPVEGRIEQ